MAAAYVERKKQIKKLGKYIKRLKSSKNEEKVKFGFHLNNIYKKLNSNNGQYHYYLISKIYKLLKTGEYKIYFKKMRLYCGEVDKKIITIDDDDVKPADCEKAASAYLAAHRPNKAIDVLQRGLESHPTSRMWWMLASTFYAKEDFEEAHHAFEKSTQSDPKNAGAHLMIGYCAIQLDHMQAAKKAFAQAARFPQQRAEAEKMLNEIDQITIVSSKEVAQRHLP